MPNRIDTAMYNQHDLDAAIQAGIFSDESVALFKQHLAAQGANNPELPTTPAIATNAVEDEQVRLITGFNDIFVVIACLMVLIPIGVMGEQHHAALGAIGVLAAAWGLAEFFTLKRRMALPSILLALVFFYGCAFLITALFPLHLISMSVMGIFPSSSNESSDISAAIKAVLPFLGSLLFINIVGSYVYWKRFKVAISVALGCVATLMPLLALLVLGIGYVFSLSDDAYMSVLSIAVLLAGVLTFALALRFDALDRARKTINADISFWLHLFAAPLLVHSFFLTLNIFDGDVNLEKSLLVGGLFVAIALISLIIDRRALMVSALGYVLVVFAQLLEKYGFSSDSFAIVACFIGVSLLVLSAFWHTCRQAILNRLPHAWVKRLPHSHVTTSV
jgi:hypothetical protein